MKTGRNHRRNEAPNRTPDILLAEDDLEMRKLLSWSLERKGYNVIECCDGTTLMKKLGLLGPENGVHAYDLIISDNRMPGATGLEVLESVRQFPDFPPMILITAFPDDESRELAMRLGAVAMIAKPFEIEDLIEEVRQAIPPQPAKRKRPPAWPATEGRLSFPFDVTFRHDASSQAAKEYIQNLAAKLEPFGEHITNGRIIVDQSDHVQHRKHHYTITLVLTTSGKSIAVKHDSNSGTNSDNLYMAINVAFGTAICKLKHYLEKKHGYRKHNSKPKPGADEDD